MILKYDCKTCGKPAKVQSEIPLTGGLITYVWQCGHTELRTKILDESDEKKFNADEIKDIDIEMLVDDFKPYQNLDGSKAAYEFQIKGIKFVESSGYNCLIADAMTLGKTIQAALVAKLHKDILTPTLIVVVGATTFQWCRELNDWTEKIPFKIRPITKVDEIYPGFEYYVISRDLLSRKGVLEALNKVGFKSIIIDEVHGFKDPEAKRTWALIKFIKQNNIKYKIALSGTPIKNRAVEYFTILNLLDPTRFYSLAQFKRDWLEKNVKGIYTKLNPYCIDLFRKVTSKYILRREKHEVLKNLPELNRDYQFIEITDPQVKASYNHQIDLFQNFLRNTSDIKANEILGWLAKLRAITGTAKCQWALDYAQEFLDSTDDSLAIGIHHKAVRDTLRFVFEAGGYNPLSLSGEDNAYAKSRVQEKFNSGQNRLLIINILAGGVGLNLPTCKNAIVLEREWNSVDEEQFEARFREAPNPNGVQNKKGVNITYPIAKGTIDEFFHDMVISKRRIFKDTMGDVYSLTSDYTSMMELAERTIANRL